jgi:hypothetical protein
MESSPLTIPESATEACPWTCFHESHAGNAGKCVFNYWYDKACFGKCGTPAPWLSHNKEEGS